MLLSLFLAFLTQFVNGCRFKPCTTLKVSVICCRMIITGPGNQFQGITCVLELHYIAVHGIAPFTQGIVFADPMTFQVRKGPILASSQGVQCKFRALFPQVQ